MITMIKGLATGGERVRMIKIAEISVDPLRIRREEDVCALLQLKDSLHRHGILVPLTVRPWEGGYRLISGERRLRAARELGFGEVPCVVFPADDRLCAEFALIESIHRRELDMFEQAEAIAGLIEGVGLSRDEVARQLSCSVGCVSNKLRLLRFEPDERAAILRGGLTERHARAILRLGSKEARLSMIDKVAQSGVSVSETEDLVDRALSAALDEIESSREGRRAARGSMIDAPIRPFRPENDTTVTGKPGEPLVSFVTGDPNEPLVSSVTDEPGKALASSFSSVDPGRKRTAKTAAERAVFIASGRARSVACLAPIENTMERAVRTLRLAGVHATVERTDADGKTVFSITVPTSIKGSA